MRVSSVLLISLLSLIGVPVKASAAPRVPTLGAAEGVTATLSAERVELRLAGPAAAAVARYVGRGASIDCASHRRPGLAFGHGDGSGGYSSTTATVRREADGTIVATAVRGSNHPRDPVFDVCELTRPGEDGRPPLARAAVTPAGAVWIDELAHTTALFDVLVQAQGAGTYPLPEALAAKVGTTVLDSPGASPPAGQVGYWSDGQDRATLVTLSGAGRRLLLEDLGDDMLRSNVGDYTSAYVPPEGAPKGVDLHANGDKDRTRPARGDPVAAKDGVRAVRDARHRLVVRFGGRAAAAFRRIAGRRVTVQCARVVPFRLFAQAALTDSLRTVVVRVPWHGGVLRTPLSGTQDVCAITDDGHAVADLTPTAAGRDAEADLGTASILFDGANAGAAAPAGATAYPSAAAVAARLGHGAIALSGPDAPVAAGHLGVWTDGAQRLEFVARSPSGRRLILADDGDGLMRSNLSTYDAVKLLQLIRRP